MTEETNETMVVEPNRKDSFYRSIELGVTRFEIEVEDSDGRPRTFRFRLLTPLKVNGKHFFEKNLRCRLEKAERNAPKKRKAFYSWTLSMIEFYRHCPPGMFRHDRKFFVRTLDKKEPFIKLAKTLGQSGAQGMGLIEEAGGTDWDIGALMEQATYIKPHLVGAPWDEGYRNFCKIVIENMKAAKGSIEESKADVLDAARAALEKLERVDEKKRQQFLDEVGRFRDENPKEMRAISFDALRRVIVDTFLLEKDQSKDIDSIGQEVYAFILEGVGEADLSKDSEELEDELAPNFREEEFNGIVHRLMRWLEEKKGVEPIRMDSEKKARELIERWERLDPDAETASPADDYLACTQALLARYAADKYKMLAWVAERFLSKTRYMDRMHREGEKLYRNLLETGYREVYRDIRHVMTREERRAYKLAHFPQPYFDNRIAIREQRVVEFANLEHEDTSARWILGLVFGLDNFGKYENNGRTLEKRWKSFLRFYPSWLEMIRGFEREEKREKKDEKIIVSTSKYLYRRDESGTPLYVNDLLKGPEDLEPDQVIGEMAKDPENPELREWVHKYCTPAQRKTMEAMFLQGFFLDLEKTAALLRLDPKTVYDHVRDGRDRIVAGLIQDGVFPKSKFPKRKRLKLK